MLESGGVTPSVEAIQGAAFGVTLGELEDDIGGGTASGRPVKAV